MRRTIRFVVLAAAAGLPGLAEVTFSDGTFNLSDWQVAEFSTGAGGAYKATHQPGGGNPGSYLQIGITVNTGPMGISSNEWGAQFQAAAIYNPKTTGAIASIDYSEDAISIGGANSGDGQGTGPAVRQKDSTGVMRVYVPTGAVTGRPVSWKSHSLPGLLASDFNLLGGPGGFLDGRFHPDFSASGSTIQFGFWRGNTSGSSGYGYSTSIGIDNWMVVVHNVPPSGVSCEVSPRNMYLGFHLPKLHISDPAHNPPHLVGVNVFSDGVPAPAASVTVTATQPVFSTSPSVLPTLMTATAQTDPQGRVTLPVSPPAPAAYDETDFDVTGSVGDKTFACKGSVVAGLGTISALMNPSNTVNRKPASLSFEPNRGQAPSRVRYLARGEGYRVYLAPDELLVAENSESPARIRFTGANAAPAIATLEELPGRSHYLMGNNSHQWHTDVPRFAKVRYGGVYPGVDIVFHGRESQLELDFVVNAGAQPDKIDLAFDGVDRLELDESGDLLLHRGQGNLRFQKPFLYQEIDGMRKPAAGRYVLKPGHHVGFEVAEYDRRRPLVIDPVVSYASYMGGGRLDGATGVAVDAQGNTYITGSTNSADFPTMNPVQKSLTGMLPLADVFVTKLDPSGAVVYSTYVGGSGNDIAMGIAVDSAGSAYVVGSTNSPDFPMAQPIQRLFGGGPSGHSADAFVFKLDASGSRLAYSTYLGGTQEDVGTGIAVDASGNAYVSGVTYSTDFPVKNALQPVSGGSGAAGSDAFVAKLSAAGTSLVYSTYLGGAGTDVANAIAVDASGNAYVTGATFSTDFPTLNALQPSNGGGQDAFVTKLNATGSALVFSTYLGGESDDLGMGIAVDSAGNVYVTGTTGSASFPLTNAAQAKFGSAELLSFDAFVTKLSADGSALAYSTYLGGSGMDVGVGIAVGPDGSAYVAGETNSADFPGIHPIQPAAGGLSDGFLAKLNPAGSSFAYATTIGGSGNDTAQAVAFHPSGVFIAGITLSQDFPATYGATQTLLRGRSDASLVKIVEGTSLPKVTTVSAASLEAGGAAASESIVSGFGTSLSAGTALATKLPLPTILGGTSVTMKDSGGNQQMAPLFFVSPGQINYLLPAGMANGLAEVTVSSADQTVATGTVRISSVAPGLFSANADGHGVAAATALRVAANGSQTSRLVFQCGSTAGSCVPAPIDLGAATDQVFLVMFGTGIRGRSSLSGVSAAVGSQSVPVVYAGPQGSFAGLDQVNLGPLPASLKNQGQVNVVVTVDGTAANPVTVSMK